MDNVVKQLKQFKTDAIYEKKKHYNAAERKRKCYKWISIIQIILNAVAGTTLFTIVFGEGSNTAEIFALVFTIGATKESQPSSKQMKKKPVIVCGDFNVAATELDIKNPKANVKNAGFTPEEREKFKTLLDSGFTDTYRYLHPDQIEYSWWSYRFKARERNAGWRIDYFLTSDFVQAKIRDARIHTGIMGSDHCPVELDIDL